MINEGGGDVGDVGGGGWGEEAEKKNALHSTISVCYRGDECDIKTPQLRLTQT